MLSGCATGNDEVDEKAVPFSTVDDYCRGRAEAECNELVATKCRATDRAACVASRAKLCRSTVPQGATYVPRVGEQCIKTVGDAYADARLQGDELLAIEQACGTRMFAGPGDARATCTVDLDCDGSRGLECFRAWNAESGKCLKPSSVGPGASCAGEADRCPTGFYCEDRAKICKPRPLPDELCQPGYMPCVESATCIGGGPFGGTCRAKLAAGEPCRYDDECADHACERPMGSPNGTCATALTLSSLSDACAGFGS
jgi:hypothetical protein